MNKYARAQARQPPGALLHTAQAGAPVLRILQKMLILDALTHFSTLNCPKSSLYRCFYIDSEKRYDKRYHFGQFKVRRCENNYDHSFRLLCAWQV
jgi:hypothetical protein